MTKEVKILEYDYAFEIGASRIRFGPSSTREVGMDLADLNVKRVMVLTDSRLSKMSPVDTLLESLSQHKVDYSLFDQVRVEPTDFSFMDAIEFARAEPFDAFVDQTLSASGGRR